MNYYNTGVNWVQGEAGARAWLMGANSTALLMDSERPQFFIKQTDQYGMPMPLRSFEYKETTQGAQIGTLPTAKDESSYKDIEGKIDALTKRIEALEGVKHESAV